jgi:glycosyltransferase involved in cell wall biosynthesis
MAVTVVIPTRNNLDELRACIDSVERQSVEVDGILVCVDGSTDGTTEYVESLPGGRVTALTHPGNEHRGRAATRNLALPHVADGFVLFLDSDMRLTTQAVEAHLGVAEAVGAVSVGAVLYENAGDNPWAGYLMRRGRNRYADGAELPFTQFTTQNALVPARAFVAIGGFDERMVEYGGEDLELAFRLQRVSGLRIVNNPSAVALTREPKTWQVAMDQFRGYGATNLHLLVNTHPDAPPTFELERRGSRRLTDRFFVAMLHPAIGRLVRAVLPVAPRALQYRLFNYEVIRSVQDGYLAGSRRAPA